MNKQQISTILILASISLGACSQSNIKTEWSCPIDQPEGCLDITDADAIAMDDLTSNSAQVKPPLATMRVERKPLDIEQSPQTKGGQHGGSMVMAPDMDTAVDTTVPVNAPTNASTNIKAERLTVALVETPSDDTANTDTLRIPERLAEIWLGAFEDEQGNYHPATRMFIVVQPAQWRLP